MKRARKALFFAVVIAAFPTWLVLSIVSDSTGWLRDCIDELLEKLADWWLP
jgi:hypothetical protein